MLTAEIFFDSYVSTVNIYGAPHVCRTCVFYCEQQAMVGWLVLAYAVLRRNASCVTRSPERWWPLALSALYLMLMLFFFGKAEGGFDSLANVQKLFTSPWVALGGWVHYLPLTCLWAHGLHAAT